MSEISDATYLRADDIQAALDLLREAGCAGLALPPRRSPRAGWVPFWYDAPGDARGAVDIFGPLTDAPLLQVHYGDDHGIWLTQAERGGSHCQLALVTPGPSTDDLDVDAVTERFVASGLLDAGQSEAWARWLFEAAEEVALDPVAAREALEEWFGWPLVRHMSNRAFAAGETDELEAAHPEAQLVESAGRKPDTPPEPNDWCPRDGLPPYMYQPVPSGEVDPAMLTRHLKHWREVGDFDDDRQAGFWVYNAYRKALPARWRHLADRVMNLRYAFGEQEGYGQPLEVTIRGILAVCDPDFDWGPYLARRKGEMRL